MYKLLDVYRQAETDEVSIKADGQGYEGRVRQGIKITKENNIVNIFNTTKGVFYQEITSEEYETFLEYGWVIGIHKMSLRNKKRKLNLIENKMRSEVNSRKNDKHIKSLKKYRKEILKEYIRITKKLNLLLIKIK
jgi:ribulose bisphosphate carboxylase small subunit